MQPISVSGPLVSIGVPVYNGEKYLVECLQSIINQTYQNWECYIINNKSTDNSLAIAEEFQARDNRMKVITNSEHVNMTSNFNNTYKPVSKDAKYFKVVCADDWIFPEYLSSMVEVMEKYPEAGFCSSFKLDNKIVKCDGLDFYKGPLFKGKEVLLDLLMKKYDITGSETTVLYRIETLKKIATYPTIFSDNSFHFDTELAYTLLSMADLAFVFQVLSFTRQHEDALTSTTSDKFTTSLNFYENAIFTYKSGNALLEKEYRKLRLTYGWFLFQRKLSYDKKCLEWHHEHLPPERRFNLSELTIIVIKIQIDRIKRIMIKIFNLGKKVPA